VRERPDAAHDEISLVPGTGVIPHAVGARLYDVAIRKPRISLVIAQFLAKCGQNEARLDDRITRTKECVDNTSL
jgi:hypothetical protein